MAVAHDVVFGAGGRKNKRRQKYRSKGREKAGKRGQQCPKLKLSG